MRNLDQLKESILKRLSALPPKEGPFVLAIDGRAASGKTTLAKQLADELEADIVHMDDFFLPLHLRTESRFAEPGGNVHYERFTEEVLPYIAKPEAFTYRKFSCKSMSYVAEQLIRAKPWRIVEGAYSTHSRFGHYYDFAVFCDVDPHIQRERIKRRDGAELAEKFQELWIPLEEAYILQDAVEERADLRVKIS